jgi:hypothetical protein
MDEQGERLRVTVPAWNVCEQPEPPPECGRECMPGDDACGASLICGPDYTCVGVCDVPMMPDAIDDLSAVPHPDVKQSHHWAHLSFHVPSSPRRIVRYELRVGTSPIVDEASFERALPAVEPRIERVQLTVPTDGQSGDPVDLDFGGLIPETSYWVAIRAVDQCNAKGPIAVAQVTTTKIHFTTVSPCFVATAAYGSALAPRVAVLRRFRDRHLMTNALGRAFVRAYYALGPYAADVIRDEPALRAATRTALRPLIALADWLD